MLVEEYSEFVCSECYGTGRVRVWCGSRGLIMKTCPKCKGAGKLDWIEHITGEHCKTKK